MTVMAMMSNNALRLIAWQEEIDKPAHREDSAGEGVLLFRLQAALLFEATSFVDSAEKWFPDVGRFLGSLPKDCLVRLDRLRASPGRAFDRWMEDHRNITFHYPEMQPDRAAAGKEEISVALDSAAELTGTIQFEHGQQSVRFGFADEVAVQWFPDADQLNALMRDVAERVINLVQVVQMMMRFYLKTERGVTVHAG